MFACQKSLLLLVILISHQASSIKASDIFASLGEMVNLVDTGVKVTEILTKYIAEEEKRLDQARKIVNDFSEINKMAVDDPEKFIGNPVNAFILIKQLTKNLQIFIDTLNNFDHLKRVVHDIQESHDLPTSNDYDGTIKAVHRLEDTYQLTTKDIRNGNLSETYPTLRRLTALECFEFGRIAYENLDYYHCINWMKEAIEALQEESLENQTNSTVLLVEILDYLSFSTAQKGNIQHAIELTEHMLKLNHEHERAKGNLIYYKKLKKERMKSLLGEVDVASVNNFKDPNTFENKREATVLDPVERNNYENLCRNTHIANIDKRLKCHYIDNHPLLVIGPIKGEQLHIQPDIWIFYDFLSENQIQIMKSLAKPMLKRAIVRNPQTGKYETADYRISKSAWLKDEDHKMFPYLTKMVEATTNLSLNTAEEWQIANYGIGGQYDPHYDFSRKIEPSNAFSGIGNRIATWMFYLEAPEEGGATVFPFINTRVKPIKGSAVFWYNLLTSGEGDHLTRHAACPVLYGSKWVSNKWLHEVGQEFNRPCNLYYEEGI